jgi:hypothetical protein
MVADLVPGPNSTAPHLEIGTDRPRQNVKRPPDPMPVQNWDSNLDLGFVAVVKGETQRCRAIMRPMEGSLGWNGHALLATGFAVYNFQAGESNPETVRDGR